jgi:DNA-directed RNA polymerase II subunit RPB2
MSSATAVALAAAASEAVRSSAASGAADGVTVAAVASAVASASGVDLDAPHAADTDESDERTGTPITPQHCWRIAEAYFEEYELASHQKRSYDDFVSYGLQKIVDNSPTITVVPNNQHSQAHPGQPTVKKVVIAFGQLGVSKPMIVEDDQSSRVLFPHEARLRNATYSSALYVDVQRRDSLVLPDGGEEVVVENLPKVFLCSLPTMLGSERCHLHGLNEKELADAKECPYDQGGYFVMNGTEKVLMAQRRMASNRIFVFAKDPKSTYTHVAETRSMTDPSRPASVVAVRLSKQDHRKRGAGSEDSVGPFVTVTLPFVRGPVSLYVVMAALGVGSTSAMLETIGVSVDDLARMKLLWPTMRQGESAKMWDRERALDYIGVRGLQMGVQRGRRIDFATSLLRNEFLPHVGWGRGTAAEKAFFLGKMVSSLVDCVVGAARPVDRDHLGNQRVDLSGELLSQIFTIAFAKLAKNLQRHCQRCVDKGQPLSVAAGVRSEMLTQDIRYVMSTGNWGLSKSAPGSVRAGVSQLMSRQSPLSALSHGRRINTPVGREGKLTKPRQLHNTAWGMVCPCETPEGQAVGLVTNLSLMAKASTGGNTEALLQFMYAWGVQLLADLTPAEAHGATKVFLDGGWVGVHTQASALVDTLLTLRRSGHVESDVSIVHDVHKDEVWVSCEPGRLIRPLLVVRDQRTVVTAEDVEATEAPDETRPWTLLERGGCVEWLDLDEEEHAMIAMGLPDLRPDNHMCRYTHCEIHPSMILGVCASIIPFPDHNQSPRNTYQSAMGKQAMGLYAMNFQHRMDTVAHVLLYPQKPSAITHAMRYLRFRELPAGQNAVVAIACYTGYNQEDSVIMNQSSIDRGFFRSVCFKTYRVEVKSGEVLGVPDHRTTEGVRDQDYSKLDVDGLVPEGTRVGVSDAIVGKTVPTGTAPGGGAALGPPRERRDASTFVNKGDAGYVDKVARGVGQFGVPFVKVRLRSVRIPQMGDKFASRHGQKGTIGLTMRQEDMPFNREGISPDIIVNPHAIPSRMTIGHLVECLLSKVSCLTGDEGDATPFTSVTVDEISSILQRFGYQKRGFEIMYNGHTGRRLDAAIFLGPTYYQRLKHMADDKIHARSRGPVTNLTRQPMEGRARDGGLRVGEMERDCMISHGAAAILKERLMDASDAFRVHVCDVCGIIAVANLNKGTFECKGCRNKTKISQVFMPYACKLLFQELMAMQIAPRMMT